MGDKSKWFAHELEPLRFSAWDDSSSLGSVLRGLREARADAEPATDESGSDSEAAVQVMKSRAHGCLASCKVEVLVALGIDSFQWIFE